MSSFYLSLFMHWEMNCSTTVCFSHKHSSFLDWNWKSFWLWLLHWTSRRRGDSDKRWVFEWCQFAMSAARSILQHTGSPIGYFRGYELPVSPAMDFTTMQKLTMLFAWPEYEVEHGETRKDEQQRATKLISWHTTLLVRVVALQLHYPWSLRFS